MGGVLVVDRRAGQILATLTVVAAVVGLVAAVRYPQAITGGSMIVVLTVTAVLLAGYLACATWLVRRGGSDDGGAGVWFGFAAATCWAIEIWAGGPARLGHAAEKATGATFALAATVATLAAGVAAASRTHRPGVVWRAGLQAGTISGALVYAFAVTMTVAALPTLGGRSDYRAQYATSHLPSMTAFLVNDILGAAAAHLMINVVLGVLGAAAGRAVLASRRRPVLSPTR